MRVRVGKGEDNGALVYARHGLDDFLGESPANGAHADDGGRLDAFDCGEQFRRRLRQQANGFERLAFEMNEARFDFR